MTPGLRSLPPLTRGARRIVLVTAPLVTVAAVGLGVYASSPAPSRSHDATAQLSAAARHASAELYERGRALGVSRSVDRTTMRSPALMGPARPHARRRLWTTAPLDIRTGPARDAKVLGVVPAAKRVGVTGWHFQGFAEIVEGGHARWVTATYLSKKKPVVQTSAPQPAGTAATPQGGLVDAPCPATASVENGLQPGAIHVYRVLCHAFPQITTFGGYAPRGEHANGKAIDAMTTDVALGNQIAAFLQAHAAELNLYDIIWQQHIWTPARASEGWRLMPDRGSTTANHYD
ncbi:MAG: hypothetical protein M3Z50_11605, partial [Actinomycetota bacterium]|nr:hypothetical protein [Actinomycetota bacterium]